MTLSTRLRKALWGLRIFGPCRNRDLAAKLGMSCPTVYSDTYRLRALGLAKLGPEGYDVTDSGRVLLAMPEGSPKEIPQPQPQVMLPFMAD